MLIRVATFVAIAMGLSASVSSVLAQTPQFNCPVRLELLTEIDGAGVGGLDRLIYGVRARDWRPEFLDQALRRYEACQTAAPGPQSLKDAERADALRQFQLLKGSLQQRDHLLALEARQGGAQKAVAQSGAAQISQSSGILTWAYTRQSPGSAPASAPRSITCAEPEKLPEDLLTLSSQSQLELPKFYATCVQAQQISSSAAALFKESIDELGQERQAQAGFIAGVRKLVAAPPPQQTDQGVSALEKINHFQASSESAANAASDQLTALRQRVDARECAAHGKQAGIPEDLLKAQYLIEWATPASLVGMACVAARNGVPFRFSAKSLLSKDSFEVKGAPRVKVVLGQQDTAEGTTLLVPLEGTVQGKTFAVTRQNIQVLAQQIRLALKSQ
ncbi:hypothetical protein CLU95_4685 [Variovorax sp. 54]|uniref:hypothetical protein n=1 Tax=Variovorax sp. 54 TaxID=2035212 RepID=UPI000C17D23C|nr:hypothetical protein [Variovorax sp. 54]PIF77510.1 hypothetical protein CLU95_4685 [Variovorax sp. 54]